MSCSHATSCHKGACKPCHGFTQSEKQAMRNAQYASFLIVNYLAITAIPKLYMGMFAFGAVHELAAKYEFKTLFGQVEDRWGSDKLLDNCAGGCAALIGVISGINVSKVQGFIVGAAFYASHIHHQAHILVPVTAFVAGQKAANFVANRL